MQLEQIFWKIVISFCLSLSKTNVQQSYLKIYARLTDIIKQKTIKNRPYNHIFLRYSHITTKILDRFFHSFSSLGLGMVQLKYQRAKPLTFYFLNL